MMEVSHRACSCSGATVSWKCVFIPRMSFLVPFIRQCVQLYALKTPWVGLGGLGGSSCALGWLHSQYQRCGGTDGCWGKWTVARGVRTWMEDPLTMKLPSASTPAAWPHACAPSPTRPCIWTPEPLPSVKMNTSGYVSTWAWHGTITTRSAKCVCTEKLHHIDAKTIFGV